MSQVMKLKIFDPCPSDGSFKRSLNPLNGFGMICENTPGCQPLFTPYLLEDLLQIIIYWDLPLILCFGLFEINKAVPDRNLVLYSPELLGTAPGNKILFP